jgi:anti-sigma28 factor (negative regulator of flagellin synthesis)
MSRERGQPPDMTAPRRETEARRNETQSNQPTKADRVKKNSTQQSPRKPASQTATRDPLQPEGKRGASGIRLNIFSGAYD